MAGSSGISGGQAAGGAAAIAGGIVSARGHYMNGVSAYERGQIEASQELQDTHYQIQALQRQAIEQLHYQFAQVGASGTQFTGSNMLVAMKTLNDLEEDKTKMDRESKKRAYSLLKMGADEFNSSMNAATGSLLQGIGQAASIMV